MAASSVLMREANPPTADVIIELLFSMQGQIIVSSMEKAEAPGTLHLWTAMGSTVEIREAKLVGKERGPERWRKQGSWDYA